MRVNITFVIVKGNLCDFSGSYRIIFCSYNNEIYQKSTRLVQRRTNKVHEHKIIFGKKTLYFNIFFVGIGGKILFKFRILRAETIEDLLYRCYMYLTE